MSPRARTRDPILATFLARVRAKEPIRTVGVRATTRETVPVESRVTTFTFDAPGAPGYRLFLRECAHPKGAMHMLPLVHWGLGVLDATGRVTAEVAVDENPFPLLHTLPAA